MKLLKLAPAVALLALTLTAPRSQAEGPETAQAMMKSAEAKAAAEHKNLLVDFGASWCGNCRLFDRFWNDPQMNPLMTKSFVRVTLTIDEHDGKHQDTPGAASVITQVGGSKDSGLPFLAMTTAKGKPIITNEKDGTPKTGIGNPDAADEVEWWMHMLEKAAPGLTTAERAEIKTWLDHHATHPRA